MTKHFRILMCVAIATTVGQTLIVATAIAGYLPPTLGRSPEAGIPGTVIQVYGERCELDGRPMEYSDVFFYLNKGQPGAPFKIYASYKVRSDATWSGHLVVPQKAPLGDYSITQTCRAADMDTGDAKMPFKVVAGAPPEIRISSPQVEFGGTIGFSGSECKGPGEVWLFDKPGTSISSPTARGTEAQIVSQTVTPDLLGRFDGDLNLRSVAAGEYELGIRCPYDNYRVESVRKPLEIMAPLSPTATPSPPTLRTRSGARGPLAETTVSTQPTTTVSTQPTMPSSTIVATSAAIIAAEPIATNQLNWWPIILGTLLLTAVGFDMWRRTIRRKQKPSI